MTCSLEGTFKGSVVFSFLRAIFNVLEKKTQSHSVIERRCILGALFAEQNSINIRKHAEDTYAVSWFPNLLFDYTLAHSFTKTVSPR